MSVPVGGRVSQLDAASVPSQMTAIVARGRNFDKLFLMGSLDPHFDARRLRICVMRTEDPTGWSRQNTGEHRHRSLPRGAGKEEGESGARARLSSGPSGKIRRRASFER